MRSTTRLLATLCVTLATPSLALAYPDGYYDITCDEGGADICERVTGISDKWVCDTTRNSGSGNSDITVVYAGPADNLCDGEDYCAFGTDDTGTLFYCKETNTNLGSIVAQGTNVTSGFDTISFHYEIDDLLYDLDTHTASTHVNGFAWGRNGRDKISGSAVNSADYTDMLHGEGGDDEISGDAGEDFIWGDGGADTIWGDAGRDEIRGGPGDDDISGGSGDDNIEGGTEDDEICGDGDTDTLHGDDGDDWLWVDDARSPSSSESVNGQDPTTTPGDRCQDDGNAVTNCESGLTYRPTGCPTP